MILIFHKDFSKRYAKLQQGEKQKTDARIRLFEGNPFHPILYNHALGGIYQGCRSVNITGNFRAIYEEIDPNTIHFIALGTHPELYD